MNEVKMTKIICKENQTLPKNVYAVKNDNS